MSRKDQPTPAPFDPQQALLALRALWVLTSYPFDDELAKHVELFGKRMRVAVAAGDVVAARAVAADVRLWLDQMQQTVWNRVVIAMGGP